MTLQWDDRYSLGHEKIDSEHHIFLNLIIEFDSLSKKGVPKAKLIGTLKEIEKYAAFHFICEENLMADCNYPELEQHTKLHQHLVATLDDQIFRFIGGTSGATEVFEFLFQWFAMHTSSEDKKLVSYIASQT